IKKLVAGRIKTAAANGEIPTATDSLSVMLYAWRQWGDPAEAAGYVRSLTDTDDKLAAFIDKFVYQTHSTVLSEGVMRTHNRLAMKQLSESLDLNVLVERLSRMAPEKLQDAEREVIRFALEQLEKMREKGLSPEEFDNSRLLLD